MTDREKPPLAANFAPATREDWRKLVDAVLKGAPFERLRSTTYDGLAIEPLAARRAGAQPRSGRRGAAPWQALARIDHPDPAEANATALHELENGASGLALVFAGAVGDHGFGLPANERTLGRVLEGVDLGAGIAVELDLTPPAEAVIDAALASGLVLSPPASNLRVGRDPLGAMAIAGGGARRWSEDAPHFARRLAALAREGVAGPQAAADGRVIHNAGGSEAQELAFVLAVATAYLRALEAEGVALDAARRILFFRLCADADQFLTMAKFRALRKLWARVEVSCALAPAPALVSAETAWRMLAARDPHVNILRATIAVVAAALGGADAITVLPFTAARGLPDAFARRIACNTQLILLEESHLAKVADPAAGSGTVEDLTDELCGAAWKLFQEIEAAGGAAAALENGLIQRNVAAIRAERAAAVARREEALTGVSIFPDLDEPVVPVLAPIPPPPRRAGPEQMFEPLPAIRLAEPFEALRDASDRFLARTGARPKIFLASLGTPADFTARATFASNFFAAGGIEAVNRESDSPPALASAFKASGVALACLCSSDSIYEREGTAAAGALKAAGARHIYLAGRPGNREAALRAAGVQSFIFEGCDALATLKGAHDIVAEKVG
jgi:methylmalonyl-CoA mutase